MTPSHFPQANAIIGPPPGFSESHVRSIPAFRGEIQGSSTFDGCLFVVVAWRPSAEELKQLNEGALVYLSCYGGLPAHQMSTSFEEATRV